MAGSDKSYLEIKVTFIHILVLLVAVILIGIFLFYLGFQAGKSSMRNQFANSSTIKDSNATEKIELQENPVDSAGSGDHSTIDNEMKLHTSPGAEKIPVKPVQKESYDSIQVGAYANFSNARQESEKFSKLGYQTEILSTILNNQKLFRVRVGKFNTLEQAENAKRRLEKADKRNYDIIKPE
jgi:cell division protein FtsN